MLARHVTLALLSTVVAAIGPAFSAGAANAPLDAPIALLGAPAQALLSVGTVTLQRTDATGPVEAGATARVTIPLTNTGGATAGAISAVLASATPCLTVTAANSNYPALAPAASAPNATPFEIRLSPQCPCPQTIGLQLTVSYTGGAAGSQVLPVSAAPSAPLVIETRLDTVAPAANSAYTATTGTQTGRINRFAPGSTCAGTRVNPGLADTAGARRYDAYSFPAAAIERCVSVSLQDLTGTTPKLFPAAYVPGFQPAAPAANWIGDSGGSPTGGAGAVSYSVNVPAGQPSTVVVHEVNVGGAPNNDYRLTVTGLDSCLLPFASVVPPTVVTAAELGDGDGHIEPCEVALLTVGVRNRGTVSATAVSGLLSTSTPGVSIANPAASFPNLAAGASGTNPTPFGVTVGPGLACGTRADFTLNLSFAGGAAGGSPASLPFSVRIGANPQIVFATGNAGTIGTGGELIAGTQEDEAVAPVLAPFAFRIYDTAIAAGDTLHVSTNGNLQLTASGAVPTSANVALPAPAFANIPVLMAYWDDLDLRTTGANQPSGIYSTVEGQAPFRTWTLTWRGETFAGDQPVEFAIRLFEGSSRFLYLYNNSVNATGQSATIGVQAGSALFTQRALNAANAVPAGSVLSAFAPACNSCTLFNDSFEFSFP